MNMPNCGIGTASERLHALLTNALSNPNPLTKHVSRRILWERLYSEFPGPRPKEMSHPDPIMSAFAQWKVLND